MSNGVSKILSEKEVKLRNKRSKALDIKIQKNAKLTQFYPRNYKKLTKKIENGSLSKNEAKSLYDHFENLGAPATNKRLIIENFLQNVNQRIGGDKAKLHKFTAVLIEVDRETTPVKNDPSQLLRNVSLARNCLEFECIANDFGKNLVPLVKENQINPFDVKTAIEKFGKELETKIPNIEEQDKVNGEKIITSTAKDTRNNTEKLESFEQKLKNANIDDTTRGDLQQKLNDLQNLEGQNQSAQKQLNNSINKLEMPEFLQDHYKNSIKPHFTQASQRNTNIPTEGKQAEAQRNAVYSTMFNTIAVVVPKYLEQEGIKITSPTTIAFQGNVKATDVGQRTLEATENFHNKLSPKPIITELNVTREEIPKVEPKTITSMSGPQAKGLDKASKTLGTKITKKNLEKTNKLLGIGASSNMNGQGSAKKIKKFLGKEKPLPEQPKKNIFAKAFDKIKQAVNTIKDRFTKPVIYASAKAVRQEETISKPLETISKPNEPLSKTQATTIEKPSFKALNQINAGPKKPTKDIVKPSPNLNQEQQGLTQGLKDKMKEKFPSQTKTQTTAQNKPNTELNQEQQGLTQELKDKIKEKFQPSQNQKTETQEVTKPSPIVPKLDIAKLMQNVSDISSNTKIAPPPTPRNNPVKGQESSNSR